MLPVLLDLLDRSIYAIRQLNYLMLVRTSATAATRLAGVFLEHEASFFGTDPPLVARGQLSALAGVTPQMVTRILRRWEWLGIVRRTGRSGLESVIAVKGCGTSSAALAFATPTTWRERGAHTRASRTRFVTDPPAIRTVASAVAMVRPDQGSAQRRFRPPGCLPCAACARDRASRESCT